MLFSLEKGEMDGVVTNDLQMRWYKTVDLNINVEYVDS